MARRALTGVTAAQQFVLATGNPGKLREFQGLLGDAFRLIPQADFGVPSVAETGVTFRDNAVLKAEHAAKLTGLPAIADDSGLEVDALNGEPGVHSARFAGEHGDDDANNELLLDRLKGVDPADRTARFRCVVAAVWPDSRTPALTADGAWEGRIALTPAGTNGFGYDPLFIVDESGRTSAQLSSGDKNRRSHRGKAVRRLRALLESRVADTPSG